MTIEAFVPADGFAIIPSDGVPLKETAYGVRANGAGTIRYETQKGTELTDTLAAGETLVMQVRKVFATGTTATGLRGNRIN